jgi:hypothetical protein
MKPRPFVRGQLVRSIANPTAPLFRVIDCGPRRVRLFSVSGPFFSCYCAPSALRAVKS